MEVALKRYEQAIKQGYIIEGQRLDNEAWRFSFIELLGSNHSMRWAGYFVVREAVPQVSQFGLRRIANLRKSIDRTQDFIAAHKNNILY